jgi:tetratricopeptide (TPR) repeat protein
LREVASTGFAFGLASLATISLTHRAHETMPVSAADDREVRCTACSSVSATRTWLAIDVVERPDLREAFLEPAAYFSTCRACGHRAMRDAPLLVVGLAEEAPGIIALPSDGIPESLPTDFDKVIDRVVQALDLEGRSLPPPPLVAPFDVLMVALGRDLKIDVGNPDAAVRSVDEQLGRVSAERHAIFLTNVLAARPHLRHAAALDELGRVSDIADLETTLERYPEILTAEFRRRSAEIASEARTAGDDVGARVGEAMLELLERCATGDIAGGWETYEVAQADISEAVAGAHLSSLREAMSEAIDGNEYARAAQLGEDLIAEVVKLRLGPMEAEWSAKTAYAYSMSPDAGQSAIVERRCVLLERALLIIDQNLSLDEASHATVLFNLSNAVNARHRGDPAANRERSIRLLRQVLELYPEEKGPTWAKAQMNLGLRLLERDLLPEVLEDKGSFRAREQQVQQDAIRHFQQALTYWTSKQNPLEWAQTEANLGLAHAWCEASDVQGLQRAIEHCRNAVRGFRAVGHAKSHAQTLANQAMGETDLALLNDTLPDDRATLLMAAERHARAAVALIGEDAHGMESGHRWWQLGRVLAVSEGYTPQTRGALQRALVDLTPDTDARMCRRVGAALGELACAANEWPVAAEALEQAARGAAAAVASRGTRGGRFQEMTQSANVFRWAAYALIWTGSPVRALEILELGRAREIALWLRGDVVHLQPLKDSNEIDRTPFVGPPRVRVGGGYGSRSKVAAGAVGSDRGLAGDGVARRTRDRRRAAERSEA